MSQAIGESNPVYGPFFGVMGAASAIIFSGKSNEDYVRPYAQISKCELCHLLPVTTPFCGTARLQDTTHTNGNRVQNCEFYCE